MPPAHSSITGEAVRFADRLGFEDLPAEAVRIAKRCILDGLGLMLAGSVQKCTALVRAYCLSFSAGEEASLLGHPPLKVPAALAALVNGTAGHAMDWDDTQLSVTPDRIYGLLTHPTIPALAAGLAIAEKAGHVSGRTFITAFLAGFEVECKIAEAIYPDHYTKGFHTSGTIGTFGSVVTAAKLLQLGPDRLRHAIGIAASMAAGIRANFGTMTKPLHVGRAAHNGVTAALLAQDGFEATPDALDGPWGFFQVMGGGFDPEKISGRFGAPHTIIDPGVSIKPYPCGVLTHPSMDAMRALVIENDVSPGEIERVVLYAGSNILNPIRYEHARDELEAKFCMPFLLSAVAVSRKAGVREFTPAFVRSPEVQALMGRIRTRFDPAIEAQGWDKIRSRIEVTLKDGRHLVRRADRYRGGPDAPLTDRELADKFYDCSTALLPETACHKIVETTAALETLGDVADLIGMTRHPSQGACR